MRRWALTNSEAQSGSVNSFLGALSRAMRAMQGGKKNVLSMRNVKHVALL